MPVTRNRLFTLDNGKSAEVDFEITHASSADFELEVKDAWLYMHRDDVEAPRIELTDAEYERFESEVALNIWEYLE